MAITPVNKIVSGGQTGVDRAALDVAIFLELPHGGWCPKGRRAEDGSIDPQYQLRETESRDYSVRTEQNVTDSDGTLILFRGRMSRGTLLTKRLADRHGRPVHEVNLDDLDAHEDDFNLAVQACAGWLKEENVNVLNVAGPRESSCEGIASDATRFMLTLLRDESAL